MKDIIALKERLSLMDQELKTLADKVIRLERRLKEVDDLNLEVKGLKVFLGRIYPEFKTQFPDIIKKLQD
jgi:argonaute-like protein implicated in RNA metabolism and viral defense